MADLDRTLTRREAIKKTAIVVGATAFVAPVVQGIFSAPAMAQTVCNGNTNSRARSVTFSPAISLNSNCGGTSLEGRYNGQNINFTITGTPSISSTVVVGASGTSNEDKNASWYSICVTGYVCSAVWTVSNCVHAILQSVPPVGATTCGPGAPALSLPYCSGRCQDSPNSRIDLISVSCCPV